MGYWIDQFKLKVINYNILFNNTTLSTFYSTVRWGFPRTGEEIVALRELPKYSGPEMTPLVVHTNPVSETIHSRSIHTPHKHSALCVPALSSYTKHWVHFRTWQLEWLADRRKINHENGFVFPRWSQFLLMPSPPIAMAYWSKVLGRNRGQVWDVLAAYSARILELCEALP